MPFPNNTLRSSSSSSSSFSPSAPATTTSMVDGTWEISVHVDDSVLKVRVRGDLHVGGLMLKIVQGLNENDRDWSDYAIWWPKKNNWLRRMRFTLDQYEIQAGAVLHFQPVHAHLYVQLPDLQIIRMRVDFSADLFSVVIVMCRQLGIRHPEELSISLPLEREDLKRDQPLARSKSQYDVLNGRSTSRDSLASSQFHRASNQSLQTSLGSNSAFLRGSFYGNRDSGRFSLRRRKKSDTIKRTISSPLSPSFVEGTLTRNKFSSPSERGSTGSLFQNPGYDLINSPWVSTREAFEVLPRPKKMAEKARCNAGWLDSSKSLMEQSVLPASLVLLKFKFYAFYDINPLYDQVRINQLYEQAKWAILMEEIECTREEMVMFAAIQLHIHQLQNPESLGHLDSTLDSTLKVHDYDFCQTPEDIIESALNDLQMSLEGSTLNYPAPFSTRRRYTSTGRSGLNSIYSTIEHSRNSTNRIPSTNSAYSIASSSSPPFYSTLSSSSRYNFGANGVFGLDTNNLSLPTHIQDITQVPVLRGCLRFYRPKRFFLKSYKKQPFMFKDLTLSMFRTANDEKPIWSLDLQGCEVTSEVLLSGRKYIIKLTVPMSRGADEIWFKMDDEEQYINWLAGLRLACQGKTMADVPSLRVEITDIQGKMALMRGVKEAKRHNNNKGHQSLVSYTNNNGYDIMDPRISSPLSDFPASTFSRTNSAQKRFLGKFKTSKDIEDSNIDLVDGVRQDGTILRSKSKYQNGQSLKNGWEGSTHPINDHKEGEEEMLHNGKTRSVSSSESMISIPKSLKESRGSLFFQMSPQDFLAPRFCRRSKLKQMLHKISDIVGEMRNASALESKLAYIKAWQSLPDFGYSYFIIRIKGTKKEDILALTPMKIFLLEGGSHEILKSWRYHELRSWSVNWEVKQVMIEFEDEEMVFRNYSSDCKVIHEYIGGYIFLSMRSPEHNHKLNQELFHKLTGGWS